MIYKRLIYDEIKKFIKSPEAIVITGMRRTGKTTLLQYIFDQITSKNKLFLDMENPLNRKYVEDENYESVKTSFEFLGIDFNKKPYLFIDEMQFVKNIPSLVKYFIDHYQVKFFLTGSASFYLKNLFTESLSGRKFLFELFPLSFREFLVFKGSFIQLPDESGNISKAIFDTVSPLYDEYIFFGGFPGVVLKTNAEEKKKVLEDIFTSFFQLEVMQLGHFRKNDVIRDLILLLMQRTGSKLDIQKLSKELKVSRPTLNEYISFLEGTYFIKTIRPFGKGISAEIKKMPKVYMCDTGIANHLAGLNKGQIFENSIFQNLRLKGELNYYQRKHGAEVDFILNKEAAYEVKLSPYQSDCNRLANVAKDLILNQFKIVSKNYTDLKDSIYGFML